jgi:hypothetical protein
MKWTHRPIPPDVQSRMGRTTEASPFRSSWSSTKTLLEHELVQLRARDAVLMLDITEDDLRIDGGLRSGAKIRSHGVALAFNSSKGPLLFTCARFRGWDNNVRAIALGLEALRKVARYGIVNTDEQYQGWRALPSPTPETWVEVLARHSGWTDAAVRANPRGAYIVASRATHPDAGGDKAIFQAVNAAYEQSRRPA